MFKSWLTIIVLTALGSAALAAGDVDFADVIDQIHRGHSAEAYDDLRRLAESGDTRAQYFLGVALIEGKELPQDLVKGYAWIQIAAECGWTCGSPGGAERAADAQVRLSKYLDGPQLIEAERIANAYLAPRREEFQAAVQRVADVLAGIVTAPDVIVHEGCAVQRDLEGCTGMPKPDPARPSCAGAGITEKRPEKPPSVTGPLARVRQPRYPMQARETDDEGRPVVLMHVDYTGYVCRAAIAHSSGSELLDAAAIASAIRWRLQPAMTGQETVEAIYPVTVSFVFSEFKLDNK